RSYSRKRRAVNTVKSVEWIRRKWHSGQRRIEIGARIFEVAKYRQVFVAQIPGERTVINLTVSRRQRGRKSSEVKRRVIPIVGHRISQIIKMGANTKM